MGYIFFVIILSLLLYTVDLPFLNNILLRFKITKALLLKILLWSIPIYIIYQISKCNEEEINEENAKVDLLIKKHRYTIWDTCSISTKEEILHEFIKHSNVLDSAMLMSLHLTSNYFRNSIKYPNTLTDMSGDKWSGNISIMRNNTTIKNKNKGIIQIHESFTSKNKLNMDVRGDVYVNIKYTAGRKRAKVINFKIE